MEFDALKQVNKQTTKDLALFTETIKRNIKNIKMTQNKTVKRDGEGE